MLFYFVGFSYNNFASCHGVTHYSLITLICASSFHWIVSTILCKHYDFKMYGIAITTTLHFVVRCIVPYVLMRCNSFFDGRILALSDKESWTGFGEIVKLGWTSVILKVMGWWAFDVFTLLAAQLSATDIAAQTILRNVGLFTYMIPVGLS